MYDLAKRSLAFTVATGGLLLMTGTAYTPALAAGRLGPAQGPAQARGQMVNAGYAFTSQASATAPDGTGPAKVQTQGRAAQPPGPPSLDVLHPHFGSPVVRAASYAPGAAANSSVADSGGILSGNAVQIPINLGVLLCGDTAAVLAAHDVYGGAECAADDGAVANSTVSHSGGIGSGNQVQVPVSIPILVCGDHVAALAAGNRTGGADCTAGTSPGSAAGSRGGAAANAVSDHSGGVLSGDIVQAPVNVPVTVCGDDVDAGVVHGVNGGSSCSTAEGSAPTVPGVPAPGSGGASATAVTTDSGGIGSGTTVQTPINVPVKLCSNTADGGVVDSTDLATDCAAITTRSATFTTASYDRGIGSGESAETPIHVPATGCRNDEGGSNCMSPGWTHPPTRPCPCTETPPPSQPPPPPSPPTRHCSCTMTPPPTTTTTMTTPPTTTTTMTTPPSSSPPSPSAPSVPASSPSPGTGGGGSSLAHTGTDIEIGLGVAGAALLAGLGLRAATRRREGEE